MIITLATSVDLETMNMFCSFAMDVTFTVVMSIVTPTSSIRFLKEIGIAYIAEKIQFTKLC